MLEHINKTGNSLINLIIYHCLYCTWIQIFKVYFDLAKLKSRSFSVIMKLYSYFGNENIKKMIIVALRAIKQASFDVRITRMCQGNELTCMSVIYSWIFEQ